MHDDLLTDVTFEQFARFCAHTTPSRWIHAKRHYGLAGRVAYWRARMSKEFKKALRG